MTLNTHTTPADLAPPVKGVCQGHHGRETSFIYRITLPNGVYVGQSVNYPKRRREHTNMAKSGKHYNPRLGRALAKHGAEVKWDIIAVVPAMWANDEETRQIRAHNCVHPHGYNLDEGGGAGRKTADTRAKISAAMTGRKRPPMSAEWRERLGASNRGKKRAPRSPEWCAKLSLAAKERIAAGKRERNAETGRFV